MTNKIRLVDASSNGSENREWPWGLTRCVAGAVVTGK